VTYANIKVREHYSATGLTDRIKLTLAAIAPESQTLNWVRAALGECSVLKRLHRNSRLHIY
jgi:hypothetical protein